jgi:hypothetical protein
VVFQNLLNYRMLMPVNRNLTNVHKSLVNSLFFTVIVKSVAYILIIPLHTQSPNI